MKIHKTKKLFYGKYPYRVEVKCPGVNLLYRYGLTEVQDFCSNKTDHWKFRKFNYVEKEKLSEIINLMPDYMDRKIKTRTEFDKLHFYLTDYAEYDKIYKHFEKWVYSITKPASDSELNQLFSKNHIVLCDRIPYNLYVFKVILNECFLSEDKKADMLDYFLRHGDAYMIKPDTIKWLSNKMHHLYDPYVYVKDSKYLLMLQLYLGSAVMRTYEFALRDTAINTVSEDELCQP